MRVLGIGTHVTCGSALIENGRVIAAVNDERLVREKMVFGFPRESIKEVLDLANISASDLDYVAVATQRQHLINKYVDFREGKFRLRRGLAKQAIFVVSSRFSGLVRKVPGLEALYYLLRQPFFVYRRTKIRTILKKEFGIDCPVRFIEHHNCHAASTFYSSPFDEATVVTLDSAGDGLSSRVYRVSGHKFEELHSVSAYNSPCAFYSYVTQVCGFKAGKHEGKITGLAAYGKPKYLEQFRNWIRLENGTFKNLSGAFFFSGLKLLRNGLPNDFKREDLASTIQKYSEEMSVEYVKHWLDISGKPDIALAGGIFANVRINQEIHEIPGVRAVHVHPAMSDEGIGLGAALALYHGLNNQDPKVESCFSHVYLGRSFSNEEIGQELNRAGLEHRRHDNVEQEIARLLAEGFVVARFNGAMEYGPRALGNRSILYHPGDPAVNDWLNAGLQRTEFMPFAPSTLAEDANNCYLGIGGAEDAARFMTITFDCTESMRASCGGVVHVDGTARPQLVSDKDNPSYYRIIKEFRKLTGVGTIINTSFNIHEEPIVCTPSDAIRAFKMGHLDYLAIGSFIVKSAFEISHPVVPMQRRANTAA